MLGRVYAGNFFYGLHFALIVYVLSTFISGHVGEAAVSLVYTSIALLSLWISMNFFRLIRKIGHRNLTLILLACTIIFSILLAGKPTTFLALLYVICYSVAEFLLLIAFDLYVEKLSKDESTGNIRGIYLTMYNLAFISGPLITGALIGEDNYALMFATGAAVLIPTLIIYLVGLKGLKETKPREANITDAIRVLERNIDIRKIFISYCTLEFFYTWMTIYTPIYLHEYIGFAWNEIGLIFTIMLLPFVLFQLPLGRIADRYLGEQEILTAGFMVAAIATIGLFFIGSKSIAVWAALLFLTRTGASAIEIMNDTYFFKQIGPKDAGVIALFRNARQLNYIAAPLVAAVVIAFLPIKTLFIVLGGVLFLGAYNATTLRDTEPTPRLKAARV